MTTLREAGLKPDRLEQETEAAGEGRPRDRPAAVLRRSKVEPGAEVTVVVGKLASNRPNRPNRASRDRAAGGWERRGEGRGPLRRALLHPSTRRLRALGESRWRVDWWRPATEAVPVRISSRRALELRRGAPVELVSRPARAAGRRGGLPGLALHGPFGEDGSIQGLARVARPSLRRLRRARLGRLHGQADPEAAARPAHGVPHQVAFTPSRRAGTGGASAARRWACRSG